MSSAASCGIVTLVSRRGETHVEALGKQAAGGSEPMRRDTIFRIASMTKPVAAAAAMILVEECRLRLDEPVPLAPEAGRPQGAEAARRAARRHRPREPADQPARPAHASDGLRLHHALPDTAPIQRAMEEARVARGPSPPSVTPDEFMKRLGALPLVHGREVDV